MDPHASPSSLTKFTKLAGSTQLLSFSVLILHCWYSLRRSIQHWFSQFIARDVLQVLIFSTVNSLWGNEIIFTFQNFEIWNLWKFLLQLIRRFFFIVLTDACCWAPIIVLKFLAFYKIEVSGDVTAWLIIFVLPLNSAVNPLLFTYTTPKYRDQIFAAFTIKRESLKKQEVTSNQNTADSQTKVSLLYNSNGSISRWKIFNK